MAGITGYGGEGMLDERGRQLEAKVYFGEMSRRLTSMRWFVGFA